MTNREIAENIYSLNDRVLINNIITQALINVIIDNNIATEDELNNVIAKEVEDVRKRLKRQYKETTNEVHKQDVDPVLLNYKKMGVTTGEA